MFCQRCFSAISLHPVKIETKNTNRTEILLFLNTPHPHFSVESVSKTPALVFRQFVRKRLQWFHTMGSKSSKASPATPPVLEKSWRQMDWGRKYDLLGFINTYKPPEGVSHLHILLYGAVGAGKSSFINSIHTALSGQAAIFAATNSRNDRCKSFTVEYETYRINKGAPEEGVFPFVFTDVMGLEPGESGILPEDIKLVMEGHVMEGYKFHPDSAISKTNKYYREEPSFEDKVHLLVCVLPADVSDIHPTIVEKINQVRKAARDLKIPEVAILTKIDLVSEEMEDDVKNVFKSKYLKKKMHEFSSSVGISLNQMFPVKNYSDGDIENDEDTDTLLLTALKQMTVYGNNSIKKLHP